MKQKGLFHLFLWDVLREDVFWAIDIGAEFEVVDFPNISFIQVLSKEKLEKTFFWWDEAKFLEDSSELFGGDMAWFSSVVIGQLWFNENSLVDNFSSNSTKES